MTYQVLARKWRPQNFAAMVGQSHVLRALSNGLANERIHHAYLFTGTRGVGKTTVARILAKCLNCEGNGVTAEPCGSCAACQEIDAGRFVDLIEVDAASRTKVEDTRELLDNVQYAPTRGRYKIYLIDEVHMLSAHSFNALLKTLEEPPEHVKFLLATTDPQKLPVTVLSRCLQFNLKPLLPTLINDQLERIVKADAINAEPAALTRLAHAADGSMRDALSLMDQALAFGAGALTEADVRSMLGTLDQDFLCELLEHLADGDGVALLATIDRLAEQSPDFGEALADLIALLHQLTLAQTVPAVLDDAASDHERRVALAKRFDAAGLQLLYQIALHGRRDLPLAPDSRAGFEMTLLRMLAFQPDVTPGGERSAPSATTSVAPRAAPAPSAPAAAPAAPVAPAAAPVAAPQATASKSDASDTDWHALVGQLPLSGMAQALAKHCDWGRRDGDRVTLHIEDGHDHLLNDNVKARLADALATHFGQALDVHIQVGGVQAETPAAADARADAERQAAAESAIEQDPNIQALKTTFGAEVIPESIRPQD